MARPKGAKNLRTEETEQFRDQMKAYCLLDGGFQRFFKELDELKGFAYVKNYLAALEFVEPKLARTEVTGKDGKDLFPQPILDVRKDDSHPEGTQSN